MKDFPVVFLLLMCIALYWLSWLVIIITPFYIVYRIRDEKKSRKILKDILDEK